MIFSNWPALHLEILAWRRGFYDNSWAGNGTHRMTDDFDRLYIVGEGEVFVREEASGLVTHLKPGRVGLFPGGPVTRFYRCPKTMTLLWLHCRIELLPGVSLFSNYNPLSRAECGQDDLDLFKSLIMEKDKNSPAGNIAAAGILCRLLRPFTPDKWENVFPSPGMTERLRPALAEIERNPERAPDIKALAGAVSMHPVYFSAVFRKTFGASPARMRTKLLMRKAKAMLEEGSMSVKDVASACGYNDPLYFSAAFRSHTGISPKEHKKTKGRLIP